jgi:hypothetical protein
MVPAVGFEPTCTRLLRPMRSAVFETAAYASSATLGRRWSARGDSNPDLHGLNVPRLPIAPRADGDHGWIRTTTEQALDLLPLPSWATWPLVPPGGLEPPLHGLRGRRAALTLRRVGADPEAAVTSDQRLERMAGLEPAPQGLEGPQATVTPHSLWFGLRVSNPSLRAGNAGCVPPHPGRTWTGVVHRPIAIRRLSKTPLMRAGGYRVWRQRQDSNPDPRVLEARMLRYTTLPLLFTSNRFRRQNLPTTWRGPLSTRQAKTKKAF